MDPSTRDDPPAASLPPPSSKAPQPQPSIDPTAWSDHLSDPSMVATPLPASSPALSSPSLLSPLDAPARPVAPLAHATPRRTTSSDSLRDDRRRSVTSLKKRSSTASLRSGHNNSAGLPSPHRSLSRRPSSLFATSPPATTNPDDDHDDTMFAKRAAMEQMVPTAASIAAEHLQREVDLHQSADLQSQTLVIVHDDCYGHRFSRPRASRAALNSIVERPERILATVLGVSAAYVRLSHRYTGGRFAPRPDLDPRQLPVPPFQIRKTSRTMALTSPAVTHVHGTKWMDDLKFMCDAAESRLALNGKELVRPPSTGKESSPSLHEGDLYLCSESLNAFQGALGGVCEGVDAVLGPSSTKRAFVCIRPPGHHCSSDHPSGFCWINNVHVGISYGAMTHGLTHAAILDFDLHHGDGSQEITWNSNQKAVTAPRNAANYRKTMIGYFSLHDINSYPCEMGEPEKVRNASVCIDKAHGQSIWNVHLEPWKTDLEFWELYASRYTILLEKARAFLRLHTDRLANTPNAPTPKAAIFISAGFDASEWEGAGMQRHKVNVPTDFYARFTADVVRMAEEEGLGVDGRVISVLEGGYSNRALTSGVLSHLSGLGDSSVNSAHGEDPQLNRPAAEMTDRLGLYGTPVPAARSCYSQPAYNPEWWSPTSLEELEALVYPPPTPTKPKPTPTYFNSTQSFAAKVVTPPRDRKSTGSVGSLEDTPPLPPVDWATATHELSKILIPSQRQTTSCRPEDLNAGASKLRRERQTVVENARSASAAPEENRMKLRVRKPKTSLPGTPRAETPKKQAVKNNRRTTIDPATDLPDPSLDKLPATPTTRSTRRKSATASAASTTRSTPDSDEPSPALDGPFPPSNGRSGTVSARKTSTSRSATPKRSASPRKVPPVPRVPSGFLSAASASEQPSTQGAHSATTADKPADDMDSLTAGVRKLNIKLKVPSPEEHAAREKKLADDRKRRSSKGSTKTPKSPSKASARKPSSSAAVSANKASRSLPTPDSSRAPSAYSVSAPVAAGNEVKLENQRPLPSLPPHQPTLPSGGWPSGAQWPGPAPSKASSTVSSVHMGPLTPDSMPAATPSQGLFSPPVSASHARSGLPMFTSSSPIPFASENRPSGMGHKTPEQSNGTQ